MITKSKLDGLANAIGSKSGEATPMTIAKMQEAVENMKTGGVVNLGWYDIKQAVNMGVDPSFLPIGTQITDKWTWQGTTYDAPWNVVHYNSNGMYLQWEYATPESMEFDAKEAIYYVGSDGLAAGTYYFSIGYTVSQWNTAKHIQFTLANNCDPGDQFVLSGVSASSDPTASRAITVYGRGSMVAKQTAKTSNGTEGTELGTFGGAGTQSGLYYQSYGNCNAIYWAQRGNHRWSQSAIRQWLNSDKPAGEWWQPLNPWDRPPSNAETIPGFLYGCNEEFKAMLEPIEVVTALDTVSGFEQAMETTYDKVFLPNAWQLYSNYNADLQDGEGESWDYWKQQAEDAGIQGMMNNTTESRNIMKHYKINATSSAAGMWLRSPVRNSESIRYVDGSGGIGGTNASNTFFCCPACIIKKSTPSYLIPSNLDWTTIKKMATLGTDSSLDIGTQIVDDWVRSDNGSTISVPWDIVHYDDKSMVLQWHYALPFGMPFDAVEALYYVGEDGLAAGTYYISIGYTDNQWTTARHIQFTLEQACDPGDQLCIDAANTSTDPTASKTITVYGYGSTIAKQTATTSDGTSGIELGSTSSGSKNDTRYKSNGQVNGIYWVFYGKHRWSQSALRQWLNSDGAAGEWWRPTNPWDRPPSYYINYPGFLYGCSTDFKNAIAVSENKTLLDTVSGFTNTYETTYDKIYLPSLEELYTVPDIYGVEGEPWLYYRQLAENAGLTGYMLQNNAAANALRIKYMYDKQTSATTVLLRSPYLTHDAVRNVTATGGCNSTSSYSPLCCCPVCKISLVK